MPNIVDRFGQLVDDAIPKPELARQLLLLGYRAKAVQLLLAPEKELTPARQYAAPIAMAAMIAPLAHPQRAALVNIFMPCELLHAFHLLPMFAEATACYLHGAAAERGFIHYAESAGISPTLCSYHKALLGMGLSSTAGQPLCTACTSIACDANNLTFRRLAQHYGIPHFYLDVPYDHDEYAVAEVSDRLREFAAFLEDALQTNPLKGEYFLPGVVSQLVGEGKARVKVLHSPDKWYGVTYQDDKPVVVAAIAEKTAAGLYPENLWGV